MRFGSFTMRFGCLWLLLLLLHFDNSHSLMFGKKTLRIRVVSYNVLSSHLASPSQFSTLDPKHLEASSRLPIVLEKLKQELDQHRNVIVCLQEVSHDWAGAFHTFFANRGYHMSTGKKRDDEPSHRWSLE
jgi:mRNA deadenylase 3'-5' endonuclease subunit Ccr4